MKYTLPLKKFSFTIFMGKVSIGFLCLLGIVIESFAQQSSSLIIEKLQEKYTKNRLNAWQLAKNKHWLIHKNYTNGNSVTLQGIDSLGEPIYYITHNIVASSGTHTTQLYKGGDLGIDLKGDSPELVGKLCIWDGGMPRLAHVEFENRIKYNDVTTTLSDHSTHLVGTLAAAGINPQAKGMAYNAKVDVWDYNDDLVEMSKEASNMLISNHAYGPIVGWYFNPDRPGKDPNLKWEWWGNTAINSQEDYRFGFYDEKAHDLDALSANSPFYLIVKSADNKRAENGPPTGTTYFLRNTNTTSNTVRSRNDGYDVIPAEANAKNILTVGGANINLVNGQVEDYTVAPFSGWGPTDDGRIKPDLLGVGNTIISAIASSNTAYATMAGTSTACANVSGSLLLLQELFFRNNQYFMRSATLKGLAIHAADKPKGKIGPSYQYGWGLLNTEKSARIILNKDLKYQIIERSLKQNEIYEYKVVANANEPLQITLCWTDLAATATKVTAQNVDNSTAKLIHDLDIIVTDEKGKTYTPWVLNPQNPNEDATTGDNTIDNVEQIYIANPTVGTTYIITIKHKRTLQANSQPYSLIISGLLPQNCNKAVELVSGRDTTLCSSNQMTLQVRGDVALEYHWQKNQQTFAITKTPLFDIKEAGQYSVKVVGYACSAQSKSVAVKTTEVNSKLSPEGVATICSGSPVKITAPTGSYQYQWYKDGSLITGANTNSISPTEAGNYNVVLINSQCKVVSKSTQLIASLKKPVISTNTGTEIPPDGSIKLTTTNIEGASYRWYLNKKQIFTAIAPRLTASEAGEYMVRVTLDGCSIDSKPLLLTSVLISNAPRSKLYQSLFVEKNLSIYPNPAQQVLTVSYLSEDTYNLKATIFTIEGKEMESKWLFDNGNIFVNQFDVTSLANGTYILRITDGVRSLSQVFLKQ